MIFVNVEEKKYDNTIFWSYKEYPDSERATDYSEEKGKIGAALTYVLGVITFIFGSDAYMELAAWHIYLVLPILVVGWVLLLVVRPKLVDKHAKKVVIEDLTAAENARIRMNKIEGMSLVIKDKYELLFSQRSGLYDIKNNAMTNPNWYQQFSSNNSILAENYGNPVEKNAGSVQYEFFTF